MRFLSDSDSVSSYTLDSTLFSTPTRHFLLYCACTSCSQQGTRGSLILNFAIEAKISVSIYKFTTTYLNLQPQIKLESLHCRQQSNRSVQRCARGKATGI
ncbi:unnamed protein product [Larinioides sclopetarius]|uniref:Uncharacterized protein n=1 Tax=Larinioides sclopetarius TaxID=280406 RepID=A0AAV2BY87_9ARAC